MEISPVSQATAGGPTVDLHAAAGSKADVHGAPADRPKIKLPELPAVGSKVGVEFSRHSSGAQIVKFYDKRTGEVIDSLPSEKVLDAVEALIDLVRKKA